MDGSRGWCTKYVGMGIGRGFDETQAGGRASRQAGLRKESIITRTALPLLLYRSYTIHADSCFAYLYTCVRDRGRAGGRSSRGNSRRPSVLCLDFVSNQPKRL